MSDEDQTEDNKGFLARWSQRKHDAKQPGRDAQTAGPETPSGPLPCGDAAQEFDLSSLPKLEDMSATTDITAFLRKGVPEHLRNAALRQSWALDPAIRNYVNPALEYAYDWNAPGGVPGNSEIEAGMDVARLVSQIMGRVEAVESPSTGASDPQAESGRAPEPGRDQMKQSAPELPAQTVRGGNEAVVIVQEQADLGEGGRNGAEQTKISKEFSSVASRQPMRRHGSAKPAV